MPFLIGDDFDAARRYAGCMDAPRVLYEDKNFVAISKPAGLLVHAVHQGARRSEPTLVEWLLARYPELHAVGDDPVMRPGIVHRLDKDTSGVMLVPRTQKYFEYLKKLFETREIKKTYLALAHGILKEKRGTVAKPIALRSGSVKRTVWKGKMKKEAVTEYRVLDSFMLRRGRREEYFSLLRVEPKTGRTHQIRVHLASIGHPVVGDTLYGENTNPFGLRRQFLHAASLEFSPDSGRRLKIEAELPRDLQRVIDELHSAR